MVWIEAERAAAKLERRAAKRQRRAERAATQRQAVLGRDGVTVTRYGYDPRAECMDCDFVLRSRAQVKVRANSVREAALRHVAETGHAVDVIIQDVTHYDPP